MIDLSKVRRIDRSAPGSFLEYARLQAIIAEGDLMAIARALESYGVDTSQLSFNELVDVIKHIAGEPTPLAATSATE
jgi:IS4 transposase